MAELIRGNPESLEGIVIVIGKCSKSSPPYTGYIASYDKNQIEELVMRMYGKEAASKIKQVNARGPLEAVSTPYFRLSCAAEEKNVGLESMDLIFAGEFEDKNELHKSVEHALKQYMVEYEEQSKKPLILLTKIDTKASYQDVAVETLADYVSKNYIEPLKHARKANDLAETVKILAEIQLFSRGSDFKHLIPEICRLVTKDMGEKQTEILNLAIREMESVAKGEYEEAAKYRDAIKAKKSEVLIS